VARPPARVLTARQLNRAVLARQLLLERAPLSIPRALERIGGIQAQYAPSMYVGLWSRLDGFERPDLTRALEDRSVVVGTLMRSTIHLVATEDYWQLAVAIRDARRAWWLRSQRRDVDADGMAEAGETVRARLRASSPISRRELDGIAGRGGSIGVGLWVDMVRVPPSSTWQRRRADLFALAEDWIGPPPAELTEAAAQEHLVRRYLEAFGPSSVAEIAGWAGLRAATVAVVVARLDLRRHAAEDGAELVDLPGAPLPDPDVPAPVRFLPVWDATLLAHARRALVIAEEDRARVFNTRTPHSVNTFTVDGRVEGTWAFRAGDVRLEPFRALAAGVRRELDVEAERIAAFHA
jgi:hypothetical protein